MCDRLGAILELNERSAATFASDGGRELIGRNVLDCHPEPARSQFAALLEGGQMKVYTIEKNGVKKLIHQALWYRDGALAGLVELSLEVSFELPHFVRG